MFFLTSIICTYIDLVIIIEVGVPENFCNVPLACLLVASSYSVVPNLKQCQLTP